MNITASQAKKDSLNKQEEMFNELIQNEISQAIQEGRSGCFIKYDSLKDFNVEVIGNIARKLREDGYETLFKKHSSVYEPFTIAQDFICKWEKATYGKALFSKEATFGYNEEEVKAIIELAETKIKEAVVQGKTSTTINLLDHVSASQLQKEKAIKILEENDFSVSDNDYTLNISWD